MVVRRSSAGAFEDEAGWGAIMILIEPDVVLIERRSRRAKVPVTLLDVSVMTVKRDMVGDWGSGSCWVAVNSIS